MHDAEIATIRRFISGHVNGGTVGDGDDLFAGGHVNSLFAVQLVMWIERTFGVSIETEDLDFANFRTVSIIASFVARKRAAVPHDEAASVGGDKWTSS